MPNKYVSRVCFAEGELIQIPNRIFDREGFIKREYKGRSIEDSVPKGIYVGECVFFASREIRDSYLGPKPKKLEDDLSEFESG